MFVRSQLPIQTTKIAIIYFQCALVPPHFENGSATHVPRRLQLLFRSDSDKSCLVNKVIIVVSLKNMSMLLSLRAMAMLF